MRKKARNPRRKQRSSKREQGGEDPSVSQILLPMVVGMVATKQELESWVVHHGLETLRQVFLDDAEEIVGPKGKHQKGRTSNHWGSADVELTFGGRRITVQKPRVRSKKDGEIELPTVEHFRQSDPLPERVVEQILLGVSTRGYGRSLGRTPEGVRSRGTSKSAASRHLVSRTKSKMVEELERPLDDVDLAVLMLDGIEVAKRTVVVALGFTADGTKVPLGLWQGSTENAALCTSLLQNLIERGLRVDRRILCVMDGAKGIRKAFEDVLGDRAVVQRCQVHKRRNVLSHLPEPRKGYVSRMMSDAYKSKTATTARKRLKALVSWLESNGEDSAAASLREGLEETLTVLKLDIGPTLRRSLSTTNAIENLLGTIRRVSRNVKRWRRGDMVQRWAALGVIAAQKKFRRIRGYRDMPSLIAALNKALDEKQEAA